MKFDVIVSNPPYNKDMYLDFVAAAYDLLSDDGMGVFITPAKFYAKGGKKNEDFRAKIMPHIKDVHLYKCCTDVFDIAEPSGIAYYSIYKNQLFNEKIITNHNKHKQLSSDAEQHTEKPCLFMPIMAMNIINKCKQLSNNKTLFDNWDFGIHYCKADAKGNATAYSTEYVTLYSGGSDGMMSNGYFDVSSLSKTTLLDKYKLYMVQQQFSGSGPRIDAAGYFAGVRKIYILKPNEIANGHYYMIGAAETEIEAQSKVSFIQSSLFGFITLMTATSNSIANIEAWQFTPALPAEYSFDHIYTDEEIFDIFQLTSEERKLITSVIKPRVKKGI